MSDRPTTAERDHRSAQESRDPETIVLTTATGAANSGYAYHDVNADGEPLCGAGGSPREFEDIPIKEATRRNKSPCQICARLRDA